MFKNCNHQTVNLSCRIDKIVYEQLLDDATKKGISLNSLVNCIAKHHVTWKRHSDEIGFVPISKTMIKKIINALDDEAIVKIAKEIGGTAVIQLYFLTYDKMSFENFMKMFEIDTMRFGAVNHSETDGKHIVNLNHCMGEKFSNFLATAHQTMADNLSLKLTVTKKEKNMLCMEIENTK